MSDSGSTSKKPEKDDEVKVELDLVKEQENSDGEAVPFVIADEAGIFRELLANRQESAALRRELQTVSDRVRGNSDRIRDQNDRLRDANDTTRRIQNELMDSMRDMKGMLERLTLSAQYAGVGNYGYQGPMGNVRQISDGTNRQQIQYHSGGPAPQQSDLQPLAIHPGRHEASAMDMIRPHHDMVNRVPVRVEAVENRYLGDRQDTFEEFSPGHPQQVAENQLIVESANEDLLTPNKQRSGGSENDHIPVNDGKSTKTAQEPTTSGGAAEEDDDHKDEDKQGAKSDN